MGTWFLAIMDESYKQAYKLIWTSTIKPFLAEHWFALLFILLVLFVINFTKAMLGRWGSLGSLIYNVLYFGVLLATVAIWGTDIFVSDFFNFACAVILYPVCYFITGWILDKFNLRRRY
jgi:hypothetical protein